MSGGGSVKGRVLLMRDARSGYQTGPLPITGACAWCGEETRAARSDRVRCLNCGSEEIDWIVSAPPTPAEPHTHVRNDHIPGSIAFSFLRRGR